MKMLKSKKGFTLIELLIVITIIGILAVAFLPTLLGAPAKGRDTQRIADLQKIQKVLINYDLENGSGYPTVPGAVAAATFFTGTSGDTWGDLYTTAFGGALPTDPDGGTYNYVAAPGSYSFGLWVPVENFESANANCSTVPGFTTGLLGTPVEANPATYCYAIFTE